MTASRSTESPRLAPAPESSVRPARDTAGQALGRLRGWAGRLRLLALVTWTACAVGLGPWPAYRGPRELGPLSGPAWGVMIAFAAAMLLAGWSQWRLAREVAAHRVDPRGSWRWALAAHVALATLAAVILGRGPASRTLLVTPVALVPALATVALVSGGILGHLGWELGRQPLVIGLLSDLPARTAARRREELLFLLATVALIVAVAWLEAQPLPAAPLPPLAGSLFVACAEGGAA